MECLLRPVMSNTSFRPAVTASSTTYWMAGLSMTGSISLGVALVAGKNLVPSPAAGITALVTSAMPRTLANPRESPGHAGTVSDVPGMQQEKAVLRQQLRAVRSALTPDARREAARRIRDALLS